MKARCPKHVGDLVKYISFIGLTLESLGGVPLFFPSLGKGDGRDNLIPYEVIGIARRGDWAQSRSIYGACSRNMNVV